MIIDTGDWHLDSGRNSFQYNQAKAHDFLDMAAPHPLILGGDSLELWANEWWEIWQGPYLSMIKRIQERKRETIVLIGNHDGEEELLKKFFPRAEVRMSITIGNRMIIHGHQFDPLLDQWQERWLAHNFDRAFTLINLPWLNVLREKIAEKDRTNGPLIDNILKVLEEGNQYLVHHSHVEEDLGWFVNPGSPLREKFPYVELEENGDCTVKYFE